MGFKRDARKICGAGICFRATNPATGVTIVLYRTRGTNQTIDMPAALKKPKQPVFIYFIVEYPPSTTISTPCM